MVQVLQPPTTFILFVKKQPNVFCITPKVISVKNVAAKILKDKVADRINKLDVTDKFSYHMANTSHIYWWNWNWQDLLIQGNDKQKAHLPHSLLQMVILLQLMISCVLHVEINPTKRFTERHELVRKIELSFLDAAKFFQDDVYTKKKLTYKQQPG